MRSERSRLSAVGVAMDCAHSKGALGDRYVFDPGAVRDKLKGLCFFVFFCYLCVEGRALQRGAAASARMW